MTLTNPPSSQDNHYLLFFLDPLRDRNVFTHLNVCMLKSDLLGTVLHCLFFT